MTPWGPLDLTTESTGLRHPVFDLFHRPNPSLSVPQIAIGQVGDERPLRMESNLYRPFTGEQGERHYAPARNGDITAEQPEKALDVYRGTQRVALITRNMLPLRGAATDSWPAPSVAFVPAAGFSVEKASSSWDMLVQSPGEGLILDWLRMLDNRIEDLAYVGGLGSRVAVLYKDAHLSKAVIRTYMAWQDPPDVQYLGLAIQRGVFANIEAECKQFVQWLDRLFGPPAV